MRARHRVGHRGREQGKDRDLARIWKISEAINRGKSILCFRVQISVAHDAVNRSHPPKRLDHQLQDPGAQQYLFRWVLSH
jgi:hypothetical protein